MKNNRWREIERIFDETLDLPETDRAAFIAQACDGDQILQHEVESLLAAHQQANGFLASSAAPLSAKQVLYAPVTMAQRPLAIEVAFPRSPRATATAGELAPGRKRMLEKRM